MRERPKTSTLGVNMIFSAEQINPDLLRRGHDVTSPKLDHEIATQEDYIRRWEDLRREGEQNGWLRYDYDLEDTVAVPVDPVHHRWVYDETEEERQTRVKEWMDATD